jgi:hypothetical protein
MAIVALLATAIVPVLVGYGGILSLGQVTPAFIAPVIIATMAVLLSLAATLTWIAKRRAGWDRWLLLLAAYAVLALPYACPILPGMFNRWSGGLGFLTAELVLLAVTVVRGSPMKL